MRLLIPVTVQELATRCLNSIKDEIDPELVIVVDNSLYGLELPFEPGMVVRKFKNLGVSKSWNIGINAVLDSNAQWLTVCSQSVVFGPNGISDLFYSLVNTDEWGAEYNGMSWHLNTFTRRFMLTAGYFDENLYPAYMEDTDMLYRMGLLGIPSPRENGRSRPYFNIDAVCTGNAQALKAGISVDFTKLTEYYERKWGGPQQHEVYREAFGDKGINWWPGVELAGAL